MALLRLEREQTLPLPYSLANDTLVVLSDDTLWPSIFEGFFLPEISPIPPETKKKSTACAVLLIHAMLFLKLLCRIGFRCQCRQQFSMNTAEATIAHHQNMIARQGRFNHHIHQ